MENNYFARKNNIKKWNVVLSEIEKIEDSVFFIETLLRRLSMSMKLETGRKSVNLKIQEFIHHGYNECGDYSPVEQTRISIPGFPSIDVDNFDIGSSIILTALQTYHNIYGGSCRLILGDQDLPKSSDPYYGDTYTLYKYIVTKISNKCVTVKLNNF